MSAALTEYLTGLDGVCSASPVKITIGRTVYEGAIYFQTRTVSPGCRAYDEGKREYVHNAIYLLGPLPPSYCRSAATAYLLDGDPSERWFVAGWFQDEPNEYHPFGPMFNLMQDTDGGVCVKDDGTPYREVPVVFAGAGEGRYGNDL